MPRKARIDAPGALHHIIARGIEGRKIFISDRDRDDFIDRLGAILPDTQTNCYAWALMPNHFHLLLRTGAVPLATVMRRLLTGYAIAFNYRHNRHGHLFQNRYKSILCQEETYLMELVRYIHLNPFRGGIVTEYDQLDRYLYCGHGVVLGKQNQSWQDSDYILSIFSKTIAAARNRYMAFVQKGIDLGRRPDLVGGGLVRSAGGWTAVLEMRQAGFKQKADERILGDGDFVSDVLRQADEHFERKYQIKQSGTDLNAVIRRAASLFDVEPEELLGIRRSEKATSARSLACYWANRELGLSQSVLAKNFGISQPTVSLSVKQGERIAKDEAYVLLESNVP